ncbi:hypothetical protein OC846_002770 [Tilletia horrida]|uniref:VPS9 domain-containing protein n=1 Tax=Tilletia horrida TaxID=155126 RepID=A0AAN6GTQ1_9BASI|nr:hypothetical protein OC846_002770 [Tilletia horrida]
MSAPQDQAPSGPERPEDGPPTTTIESTTSGSSDAPSATPANGSEENNTLAASTHENQGPTATTEGEEKLRRKEEVEAIETDASTPASVPVPNVEDELEAVPSGQAKDTPTDTHAQVKKHTESDETRATTADTVSTSDPLSTTTSAAQYKEVGQLGDDLDSLHVVERDQQAPAAIAKDATVQSSLDQSSTSGTIAGQNTAPDTVRSPPDSPAPSVPSKTSTPRVERTTVAPTRQGSLPLPPLPPEASSSTTAPITPASVASPRIATSPATGGTAGARLSRSGLPPPAAGQNVPEEMPFDFNRFLEQMRHRSALPVGEYVRSFIRGFSKKPYRTPDQIRLIFDFLAFITDKMREAEVWASQSPAEFENATEAMEKLIMNRLYNLTFTPAVAKEGKWPVQSDDLERDRIIKDRILLFSWVRPEHLDIPVGEHTTGFVEFAAQELLKMNNYKAPRDKLICTLNCCKVIFGMIRHMATSESADSFVPALIYVVLKANPDHLVSNVEYISRFRSPERLTSESGYYLSSLAGTISFIETMDHTSLTGVSQEEMERNVNAAVTALALAAPVEDVPSPSRTISGSNSPFGNVGEEGARTLQSLAPIAASLADDTRQFLQRTGEAARAGFAGGFGKPIGALGKLFNEGLDGIRSPSPGSGSNSEARGGPGSGPGTPPAHNPR